MGSEPRRMNAGRKKYSPSNWYAFPTALIFLLAIFIGSNLQFHEEKTLGEDFTVKTLSGSTFSIVENRGKVILVNFMETSCSYCRAQVVELKKIWDKYGDKIVLVSISGSPFVDTEETLRYFAETNGANWTWARDVVGAASKYRVTGFPTTFIIDQRGYVKYKLVGVTYAQKIEGYLDEILGNG